MFTIDRDYVIRIRRELHRIPELTFDLPKTTAVVKRELNALGIPYTEEYGQCSVVGIINPDCTTKTVGIRADMDALPVDEATNLPFRSEHPGKMHACGHDAHTAMLLGAAKALKEIERDLPCRVKLLFQPSEEGGGGSGAAMMVQNGALKDVDIVLAQHVDGTLDSGLVGICVGNAMASSHSYRIEFFGKTAHATMPDTGIDALSAAATAYCGIRTLRANETDPDEPIICSVNSFHAGTTQNVVADHAVLLGTVRTFNLETDTFLARRIEEICQAAVEGTGVTYTNTNVLRSPFVNNDAIISAQVRTAAEMVAGADNVISLSPQMASEDFAHMQTVCPGVMFRLGTRNLDKGITANLHNPNFTVDEDALVVGARVFAQFVCNQ